MTRIVVKSPGPQPDARADTRETLLIIAMRLFAQHGIDGISLKTISDAAGSRNKSAVGYHFENKQGLIHALLRRIESDLAPPMTARIAAFESALDRGERPSLGDVVLGLLEPLLLLYTTKSYGRDALRVLARMMHDPIESIPADIRGETDLLIERAIAVIHRILPEKPMRELQHHVHHTIMAAVNGLAMQQRFIERGETRWSRAPLGEIFLSYAGFVAAGLAGRPLALDPAIETAWKKRMNKLVTAS